MQAIADGILSCVGACLCCWWCCMPVGKCGTPAVKRRQERQLRALERLYSQPYSSSEPASKRARSKDAGQEATQRARWQSKWAFPGLMTRPRALSIGPDATEFHAHHQQETSLLFKCPPEVRNLIYIHAMGGHLIHLRDYNQTPWQENWWERPLWAYACVQSHCYSDSALNQFLRPLVHPDVDSPLQVHEFYSEDPHHSDLFVSRLKLLSLPQTCRRVYSECIDFLYQHNTFDLSCNVLRRPDPKLKSHMLPQRLMYIRSIRLKLRYLEKLQNLGWRADHVASPIVLGDLFELLPGLRELELVVGPLVDGLRWGVPSNFHNYVPEKIEGRLLGPPEAINDKPLHIDVRVSLRNVDFDEEDLGRFRKLRLFDIDGNLVFPLTERYATVGLGE